MIWAMLGNCELPIEIDFMPRKSTPSTKPGPLSWEEINTSILEMLRAGECEVDVLKDGRVFKIKPTEIGQKDERYVKIDQINRSIMEAGFVLSEEDKEKKTYTLAPERAYVRRTAKEFAAGAEPVTVSGSHRLKQVALTLTPDLHAAAKQAAEQADIKFVEWVRAAIRGALRNGMDARYELDTPVEIEAEDSANPYIGPK